jgi:hypothetical protein
MFEHDNLLLLNDILLKIIKIGYFKTAPGGLFLAVGYSGKTILYEARKYEFGVAICGITFARYLMNSRPATP